MKKSLNAWTVDSRTNFEDMFKQIKAAGFDGIELNVDKVGSSAHSLTLDTTDEHLEVIKSISEKYNLPVVSISTSLYGGNMGSKKADEREFAKKIMAQQLKCAQALGASGILTVPGGISEDVSTAEAYENSFATLESCKAMIEEYKIYVGLENVWNTFFLSPFDMKNFIDRLNCKYITAYYDVGNTVAFSWTEYWIDILGNRISHIHVKDFKKNSAWVNQGGNFVDLCKGSIKWQKVVPALKKAGFDGYLTAEVGKSDSNQSFEEYYKEVADAIGRIIDGTAE